MKKDVFLQVSAVTACLYHRPPTVVPQGSPRHSCDPVKSIGKQVNPCTVLGRRFCALRNGTCFPPIYCVNLYSDYLGNVSCIFFFCTYFTVDCCK